MVDGTLRACTTREETHTSFFGEILDKLGFGPAEAEPAPQPQAPPTSGVDAVAKLEGLAAANPQKRNWKTSIVDRLKLLDLDSSLAARRDLASELGCPADRMGDSAAMNIWLHKTVLRKLAENGGNVPRDLLD